MIQLERTNVGALEWAMDSNIPATEAIVKLSQDLGLFVSSIETLPPAAAILWLLKRRRYALSCCATKVSMRA